MRSSSGRSVSAKRAPERRWEISEHSWRSVERALHHLDPPPSTGRPRIDPRRALNGILYRECTGCRWRDIPARYGDDATIHRTFRRWLGLGLLEKIRQILGEAPEIVPFPRRPPASRPGSRRRPSSADHR